MGSVAFLFWFSALVPYVTSTSCCESHVLCPLRQLPTSGKHRPLVTSVAFFFVRVRSATSTNCSESDVVYSVQDMPISGQYLPVATSAASFFLPAGRRPLAAAVLIH